MGEVMKFENYALLFCFSVGWGFGGLITDSMKISEELPPIEYKEYHIVDRHTICYVDNEGTVREAMGRKIIFENGNKNEISKDSFSNLKISKVVKGADNVHLR